MSWNYKNITRHNAHYKEIQTIQLVPGSTNSRLLVDYLHYLSSGMPQSFMVNKTQVTYSANIGHLYCNNYS